MDALDLLVDFTSLVSMSDASKAHAVSKEEDASPTSDRSATLSATTLVADPFTHNSINELPIDRAQHYFPLLQSTLQQAAVHHSAPKMQASDYFTCYFPSPQVPPRPAQTFDQHLQQNPGLGLPYEMACRVAEPHMTCDCEYVPTWNLGYEAFPQPWNANQPFHEARPQTDMRFVGGAAMGGFECGNELCGCQYAIPHTFHGSELAWKMEGPVQQNGYEGWGVTDKQFRT